ncbi:MAG: hypothetical protein KC729_08280, partial [Candidatus Eisenbacteria bacterium]|nr:hypothetical protein [Candidatus Eisenbacteria bacterium]
MNRNVIGQQAPGGSQERRRLTGAIMLAAFLLLSAILTFGQLPRGGPDLVGDVWKVDVDGHPCILFLTETEVVSLREFPGRYRPAGRVEDRVQNHLNVVRADEGGRLARTKIAEREHSRTVDLLGVAGGWIWLLSDGIEAREPRRLRRTLSKKDRRRANPDEAGGIDDEARFYALTPSLGGLAVRTTDGRLHLVQPPDPAFHPLDRLPEPSSIASEKTARLTFAADAVVGDRRLLLASDYERQFMDD